MDNLPLALLYECLRSLDTSSLLAVFAVSTLFRVSARDCPSLAALSHGVCTVPRRDLCRLLQVLERVGPRQRRVDLRPAGTYRGWPPASPGPGRSWPAFVVDRLRQLHFQGRRLEQLSLVQSDLSDAVLSVLAPIQGLLDLNLSHNPLTVTALPALLQLLANNPGLLSLRLRCLRTRGDPSFTVASILRALPRLTVLDLRGTVIQHEDPEASVTSGRPITAVCLRELRMPKNDQPSSVLLSFAFLLTTTFPVLEVLDLSHVRPAISTDHYRQLLSRVSNSLRELVLPRFLDPDFDTLVPDLVATRLETLVVNSVYSWDADGPMLLVSDGLHALPQLYNQSLTADMPTRLRIRRV